MMDKLLHVLILEDSPDDAELLIIELKKNGFNTKWKRVETKIEFEKSLQNEEWDIILSDYVMQGFTGIDALHIFKQSSIEIPFILVSGSIGEEPAVEAMRIGAHDYIMKDNIMRLGSAVKRELKDALIRREHQHAIDALRISEQEWRSTFNAISDSVSIVNPDGKILNTNKSTSLFFSISFDNILGKKIRELLPALSESETKEILASIFETKAPIIKSIKWKEKWYKVSFDPIIEHASVKATVMVIKDITNEKKWADELKNSQQKLESVLVSAPVGIGIVNNNNIGFVNDRLCRMLGYDSDEIIGKPISVLFDPNKSDYQGIEFDQKQNFDFYSTETRYRCKNGNILHVYVNSTWLNPKNKAQGITFTIQDISAIKHAEIQLKDSEERFRALSNATNEAIFISKKGICIETNKAASNMFGYSYDELMGIFGTDTIAGESKELVKKYMLMGYSEPYEAIGLRKDGSRFYGEFTGKMYKFRGQDVRITTVRDLTKQKKAENALNKSLKEFKALSDNLPLGVYRTSINGNILAFNPAFSIIFGYKKGVLLEQINSADFYKDKNGRKKFLDLIEKSNWVKSFQIELIKNDGTVFWASINARMMFDEDGQPEFIDGIVEDITEIKKIQFELVKAREKAEESDRLKSAFLANISHEIRTPMNAILGFSELLCANDTTPKEKKYFQNNILSNGILLLQIINDIMDISRIETGVLKMHNENCNINNILKDIIINTRKTIVEKKKDLKIELQTPKENPNPNIFSDPMRFQQIFTNLIDNAEKFTKSGKIECGYTTKEIEGSQSIINIYVRDTGIGIPRDKLEIIFDRFRQVDDSHNREYGGAGLGLSITQKLVEAMGGKIIVESSVGSGSVFSVTLPFVQKATPASTDKIKKSQNIIFDWSKNLFLIVEDMPANYLFLEKMLKATSVQIIWARNGKDAIEKYDENKDIDLVIMDINLPEINGLDVTRYIRSKDKDIPVIAQTAYVQEEDIKDCTNAGCTDFISKPINRKEFIELIARYLPTK
ncbi:MAG: PAS domain S-box protein [Bacteroidota bacterium]|nr:PAS domain S-box protein [Bacteroidota bacterium]